MNTTKYGSKIPTMETRIPASSKIEPRILAEECHEDPPQGCLEDPRQGYQKDPSLIDNSLLEPVDESSR